MAPNKLVESQEAYKKRSVFIARIEEHVVAFDNRPLEDGSNAVRYGNKPLFTVSNHQWSSVALTPPLLALTPPPLVSQHFCAAGEKFGGFSAFWL